MPLVKFPLPTLFSRSSDETSLPDQVGARLVNAWVEKIGGKPIIRKAFGLEQLPNGDLAADLPIDGLFWWDAKGVLIAICNGNVYVLYASTGSFTNITGDALTVIGPVTFACNEYQAILASGGRMVSINVENLPSTTPALAIGSTTTRVANGACTYYIGSTSYSWPANAVGIPPGNDVIPQGKFGAVAIDVYGTGFPILPGLTIGTSNAAHVKCGNFSYYISGTLYNKTSAETAPGNDVVPQNKYGAVAFDIGADGTIDAIEAAANATGYDSASLAIAGIPAVAAAHIRMGTVTVIRTGGDFTFGTTLLSDATTTDTYTDSTATAYTATEATDNAAGYATADEAIRGLPLVASTKCRLGVVTAMKNDGAFTFNSTALNAANTTVAYTSYVRNSNTHIQATRFLSDTDAPTTVSHVAWMDGYFLANNLNTRRFHWSEADDPFAWGALSFSSAEGNPDYINALKVAWLEVTLFGRETLETFFDDGSSPFARIEGGVLERGCLAPYSIVNAGGTWVWLDNHRKVITLNGRSWSEKSGPYDSIISGIEDVSGAWAVCFTFAGQTFYALTFPTEDLTVVWNMTTDTWAEWGTWDSDTATYSKWNGKVYAYARSWDLHLIGDATDSKIYILRSNNFQEAGASIRSYMKTAPVSHGTMARKKSKGMMINVKRGQGVAGGSEPVMALRWRDDNGSWSNEHQIGLGEIGEHENIVRFCKGRMGIYRTRQLEFVHTDNSDFRLNEIEEDVEMVS